jgi:hypothetical protein
LFYFSRRETGTIHFCSRSLILEVEEDQSSPIYKYPFRYIDQAPQLVASQNRPAGSNQKSIVLEASRLMEVHAGRVPRAYKQHMADKSKPYQLEITLDLGGNIEQLQKAIASLLEKYKSKTTFHYEEDVQGGLHDLLDIYSNAVFDKTRIKSLNETSLLSGIDSQKEF